MGAWPPPPAARSPAGSPSRRPAGRISRFEAWRRSSDSSGEGVVGGSSRLTPSLRGQGCHRYCCGCCFWVYSCRDFLTSCPMRPPVGVRFSGPVRYVTRPHVSSCRRRATTSRCVSCCRATPGRRPWRRAVPGALTQTHSSPPKVIVTSSRRRVASVYILRGDWSRPLAGATTAAVNPGCGCGQAGRAKHPSCCSCCCDAAVDERQGEQRHRSAHQSVKTHTPVAATLANLDDHAYVNDLSACR